MGQKKQDDVDFEESDFATEADEKAAQPSQSDRARSAANMRTAGAPYDFIATTLGYTSAAAARMAAEKVFADMFEASDLRSARNLAHSRLEKLLRKADAKAFKEFVKARINGEEVDVPNEDQLRWAGMYLSVVDRLIRLDGLDAPQRVEFRIPEAAEFDSVVRTMVLEAGGQLAIEADPFEVEDIVDAEVVDDARA